MSAGAVNRTFSVGRLQIMNYEQAFQLKHEYADGRRVRTFCVAPDGDEEDLRARTAARILDLAFISTSYGHTNIVWLETTSDNPNVDEYRIPIGFHDLELPVLKFGEQVRNKKGWKIPQELIENPKTFETVDSTISMERLDDIFRERTRLYAAKRAKFFAERENELPPVGLLSGASLSPTVWYAAVQAGKLLDYKPSSVSYKRIFFGSELSIDSKHPKPIRLEAVTRFIPGKEAYHTEQLLYLVTSDTQRDRNSGTGAWVGGMFH